VYNKAGRLQSFTLFAPFKASASNALSSHIKGGWLFLDDQLALALCGRSVDRHYAGGDQIEVTLLTSESPQSHTKARR
jgi:hypothetical protein